MRRLLMCLALSATVFATVGAATIESATVAFPADPKVGQREEDGVEDAGPILSEAADGALTRDERSAAAGNSDDYEYVDVDGAAADGPEGRFLSKHKIKKIKKKLKPYLHGGHGGGGWFPGGGGGGFYGPSFGGGHGGHHQHHGGHHHGGGGFGGWNQPHYGGGGAIASAFAGPSPGYGGGWNKPGFGGFGGGGYGGRPGHAQVATWNLGPFQASFGLAQAGK